MVIMDEKGEVVNRLKGVVNKKERRIDVVFKDVRLGTSNVSSVVSRGPTKNGI